MKLKKGLFPTLKIKYSSMRKLIFILIAVLFTHQSFSQIFDPVKWEFEKVEISNNEYELKFTATIENGWHLYSQNIDEGGPIPTTFTFTPNEKIKFNNKVIEPSPLKEYDPNFDMELGWFENKVTFKQKIEILSSTALEGEVEFMVCDEEKCLPPKYISYSFDLPYSKATEPDTQEKPLKEKTPESSPPNNAIDQTEANIPKSDKLALETNSFSTTTTSDDEVVLKDSSKNIINTDSKFSYKSKTIDINNPLSTCDVSEEKVATKSNLSIFILGFLGGLLALLTPCVFPMIPLTVSFFTKGDKNNKGVSNAILYGFFILMVYVVLSIPFHVLDSIDPNILNTISTNIYLNLAFFVVFIVFAISFFGYFEITLPSSIANKADQASSAGGIIGIFFMALTLALVSFSCTGPILGSLLAGSLSSDGGAMQLTSGMTGFGLALALPFGLFAAFPSWLDSLPKSGGWLTSVKVILGFIELALAFKFLSNADLVSHWNLITYELFLAIWIIICVCAALYLMGVIKFPHDSPIRKFSIFRIILIGAFLSGAIYLCTGFKYNEDTQTFTPLSLLSGLAPPAGYSWIHPNHCPLNLNCFHDYEEGLAYAKKVNKPIMLDFTGWACVNCRKMEENVWNKPEVFKIINQDYVLISLYVDDREKLANSDQHMFISENGQKKKIRTIGDKWATFQTETFVNNSQPYYALLSKDEKLLLSPVGYTPEVTSFRTYLECGLKANKINN